MEAFALALWLNHSIVAEAINPLPAILVKKQGEAAVQHFFRPLAVTPDGFVMTKSSISENRRFAYPTGAVQEGIVNHESVYLSAPRVGDKLKIKTMIAGDWAAISGQVKIRDPDIVRDDPLRRGGSWSTDETLKVPVSQSFFVFGAMDAASDSVEQQQLRWLGKTGVGVKVRPWLWDEIQLRGGPAMRYDDQDRPPRGYSAERSELFLDVSTKLPVTIAGRPVNVEYTGTSIPAITGYDRPRLNQDLKFALPLADGLSRFQVGAKLRWEDSATPTPWTDRTQLYLGLELKH